jgi:hypothetical protein
MPAELKGCFDILEMSNRNKITESNEEIDEIIAKFVKYESYDVKDLIIDAEIVFLDFHYCNDNLKVRGKDKFTVKNDEVIA